RTRSMIYGGINETRWDLLGQIDYNNRGLHYYATPVDSLIKDSIAQRYSDFGINLRYRNHVKDSAKVNYSVGMEYRNFGSKKPLQDSLSDWRARENFFGISGEVFYKLNKEVYALGIDIKNNAYRYGLADSSISLIDSGLV